MASPAGQLVGTLVIAALIAFLAFRRVKRNFGRQRLRPGWIMVRLALLGPLTLLLSAVVLDSRPAALAAFPGLVGGVALGAWAAKRTRFARQQGALYYVPHTYAGVVVTALFLGRLLYRLLFTSFDQLDENALAAPTPLATLQQSSFTLAILFVLLGYNLYYYSRLLWKSRHAAAQDFEPT
jgi:hypothetical protein